MVGVGSLASFCTLWYVVGISPISMIFGVVVTMDSGKVSIQRNRCVIKGLDVMSDISSRAEECT